MVHTELQLEALGKDQQRIESMRARNEARRERFLNARQRAIGIDTDSLDQQVAEKMASHAGAKDEEAEHAQRQQYISMLVEQREAQENAIKKAEHNALKGVWDGQCTQPKNDCSKMADPVVADACGLAAGQKFDGEDRSKGSRVRLQAAQMKSWTTQQMAEKQARHAEDKDEEARYAEYLKTVQDARDALESEEGDERRRQTVLMKDDNRALASEIAGRKSAHKQATAAHDAKELAKNYADPVLCEDTSAMISAMGENRIRRDHFKGFSKAQIQQIYLENQRVCEEKAGIQGADADEEAVLALQQEELRKLVEEAEYEQMQQQRAVQADHKAILEAQREEQAAMRATEKKESKGHIQGGLMDGFGCSWR